MTNLNIYSKLINFATCTPTCHGFAIYFYVFICIKIQSIEFCYENNKQKNLSRNNSGKIIKNIKNGV